MSLERGREYVYMITSSAYKTSWCKVPTMTQKRYVRVLDALICSVCVFVLLWSTSHRKNPFTNTLTHSYLGNTSTHSTHAHFNSQHSFQPPEGNICYCWSILEHFTSLLLGDKRCTFLQHWIIQDISTQCGWCGRAHGSWWSQRYTPQRLFYSSEDRALHQNPSYFS